MPAFRRENLATLDKRLKILETRVGMLKQPSWEYVFVYRDPSPADPPPAPVVELQPEPAPAAPAPGKFVRGPDFNRCARCWVALPPGPELCAKSRGNDGATGLGLAGWPETQASRRFPLRKNRSADAGHVAPTVAARLVAAIQAGKVASATGRAFGRLPFGQAADKYVEDRRGRVAPRTEQLEKERLVPLRAFFGERLLGKISAEEIATFDVGALLPRSDGGQAGSGGEAVQRADGPRAGGGGGSGGRSREGQLRWGYRQGARNCGLGGRGAASVAADAKRGERGCCTAEIALPLFPSNI